MIDAYDEEVVGDGERTVLRLHPALAPVKAAVLPLIGKREDMVVEGARAVRGAARRRAVEYDDGGAIGRRYRRQDEIGTPYAFTIDDQTLEDETVTVRDRDSLAQERLPIGGVRAWLGRLAPTALDDAEVDDRALERTGRPGASTSTSSSATRSAATARRPARASALGLRPARLRRRAGAALPVDLRHPGLHRPARHVAEPLGVRREDVRRSSRTTSSRRATSRRHRRLGRRVDDDRRLAVPRLARDRAVPHATSATSSCRSSTSGTARCAERPSTAGSRGSRPAATARW